jgi:O-antigen polymerase
LVQTHFLKQYLETYRYAGNMIPCRFEPLDGMMTLYLSSGDTLNAVRIAREIVAKPVKVPSSRVNVIVAAAKQLIE